MADPALSNIKSLPGVETYAPPPLPVWATPFAWREPQTIPPRRWLYGGHYIRRFVSTTVAPGGVGKSSLVLIEALAMASGKALLSFTPTGRLRCWYFNGEDPLEETERRIAAACQEFGLRPGDLEGWLFLGSGRDTALVMAEQSSQGAVINVPHVEGLEAMLRDLRIDVAILDPFVSTHRVPENDNGAIELVAKEWARLSDRAGAAVELVHHVRKGSGPAHEYTVEDGRGASALLAAARSARVLNPMSDDEANRAGVDRRRSYFRVENGKANLAPPPETADWYRIKGVDLGNGDELNAADSVGVVTAWQWPDHLEGVSVHDLLRVQQAVDGGRWRESPQAKDWVGVAIGQAMRLDPEDRRAKAKIKALQKLWLESGALVVVQGQDAKRNTRTFVEVGTWADTSVQVFQ